MLGSKRMANNIYFKANNIYFAFKKIKLTFLQVMDNLYKIYILI